MPFSIRNNTFLIILLFVFTGSLISQNYPSKNISIANGLPNNQVEAIFKDSRGILWVGTNNGLSKIKNGEIVNFFEKDGLAHNSVWDIVEDSNKNLWFASHGGGITKFDGDSFQVFNEDNGLCDNRIRNYFYLINTFLLVQKMDYQLLILKLIKFQPLNQILKNSR